MALSRYSDSVSSNPHRLENIETSNNYDIVKQVNVAIDPEFYASSENIICYAVSRADEGITVTKTQAVSVSAMATAGSRY